MQIKFRAWDIINKCWINISSLQIASNGAVMGVWELKEDENELFGLHQVKLMQSTGLLDKNGKEIYEGDILKEVLPFNCNIEVEMTPQFYYDWEEFIGEKNAEIIGNIYESPELLTIKE